jgi:hypothetical protein
VGVLMKKMKARFGKPETQGFLFALALLLLNWPLLSIAGDKGPFSLYIYLFLVWLVIILLIFIIAISAGSGTPPPDAKEGNDDV